MKFGRVLFYGILIWVILFFVGWLLSIVLPFTMGIILLILGVILIYTFSRVLLEDNHMFVVGLVWLVVNFVLDFLFEYVLSNKVEYFFGWSLWLFYVLLLLEPSIVKKLSKK
jgi:hypothetical protein